MFTTFQAEQNVCQYDKIEVKCNIVTVKKMSVGEGDSYFWTQEENNFLTAWARYDHSLHYSE